MNQRTAAAASMPCYYRPHEGEIGRDTSELQSHHDLVCRLLLEKKKPHEDCGPRVSDLVRYYLQHVTLNRAWRVPAALQFLDHAQSDGARLSVLQVRSASRFRTR